ncbi:MAG: sensor histidine kinase [Dyadobacter sp.]
MYISLPSMTPEKSKSSLTTFVHVIIWLLLGFALLFYPPFAWSITPPTYFWVKQTFNLILYAIVFYLNAYYAAPVLLLQKNKTAAYVGWMVLATVLILVLARIVEVQLGVLRDMSLLNNKPLKSNYSLDYHLFMICLLVMVVSTTLAVLERWRADAQAHERIEKQHITSELALLKAQINPHFFFNTLNNIYSLTFSDVPVSREALLKLSRMMRYVLYDTIQDVAPVSQEILFLKDYISLMRLRLHDYTRLEFEEPAVDGDYMIAPMLLLPFIENAFKHGTSTMSQANIVIELAVRNKVLTLAVFNHISHQKDEYHFDKGGIGLVNTKKRLNLLYPDRHHLIIKEDLENRTYHILLTIDL